MKLASLKETYKEWNGEPSPDEKKADYYPCLYLDEKALSAMEVPSVRTGTEMIFTAKVRVSQSTENSNGSRSMSFELMEGAMTPAEKEPDAASVLFPNG